ncbi:MAG TPA: BON domain-containing protein [Bacteroidia bacterium]
MKTDLEIQQDVMEELKWEPYLTASEIGVSVRKGVVTLSGIVDTFAKKVLAEKAALRVAGVKAVAEDIEVEPVSDGIKNDTEIAEAVMHALKWNSAVQEEKIKVKVENGWVTLEGEVQWEFQRNTIKAAVEPLVGVVGISNYIDIRPEVKAEDVKRQINSAFHRSATVDAENVKISVNGSKVVLSGKVRSYSEKQDAEDAAWAAPGVITVENNIEVDSEMVAY